MDWKKSEEEREKEMRGRVSYRQHSETFVLLWYAVCCSDMH